MQRFDPKSFGLREHLNYTRELIDNDGPEPSHFRQHRDWYSLLNSQIRDGIITEAERCLIRTTFGEAYSTKTLQGYVFQRPLGYAGDYSLIDKIYKSQVSEDPRFTKYDQFFQSQQAAIAVRNRKDYFKELVREVAERSSHPIRVLNLACGPCRDLQELLAESPSIPASFLCVDIDNAALEYAKKHIGSTDGRVSFEYANVLRMKPTEQFDLIWSAGLFDYFNDRIFVRVVANFLPYLKVDGEMTVGNFGSDNPTRGSMEALANWYLHHRPDDTLTDLANRAIARNDSYKVAIGFEPTGVNRFLHIRHVTSELRHDPPHRGIRSPNWTSMPIRPTKEATDE